MPPWLIALICTIAAIVFFVILGILLVSYLTINVNIEVKPLSMTTVTFQMPVPERPQITALEKTTEARPPLTTQRSILPTPIQVAQAAEKVWSFLDSNRAQVDVTAKYGTFLPSKPTDPYKFQHWSSPPATQSFVVIVYNRLGRRIVQFEYSLQFIHSGSVDSNESYLCYATVVPSYVSVSWGFKLKANIELSAVRNVGTAEEPIAAVTLDQRYQLSGFNTIQRVDSFEVRGDGKWTRLNHSTGRIN